MRIPGDSARRMTSLPSRERGLKFMMLRFPRLSALVAPLAGARIEISMSWVYRLRQKVAPLAGARIEIPLIH